MLARSTLFVAAVLLGLATASVHPRLGPKVSAKARATYPAQYFQQILDHFDPSSSPVTFTQKFYTVLDNWKAPNGPFILYVAGEGPQDGPEGVDDEIAVIAKQNGAAVLTLEHRFFGESLPFDNLKTENLKYLTVEQELEDLAYFLKYWQASVNKQYGKTTRNKALVIGGSYAGMISANLRLVHPEIIDVSWSSSGVVNAIYNFTTFDMQVAISLGQKCGQITRLVEEKIEEQLALSPRSNAAVKALFNATGMSDSDFLWMLSDAQTLPLQYGLRSKYCAPLETAFDSNQDIVAAMAQMCNDVFYPVFCGEAGPYLYSDEVMKDTNITSSSAQRAWWWFVCNELSYAQAYPGPQGIRSSKITMEWHKQKCDSVFGPGIWPPKTQAFNEKYGADHPKSTNVVFINASQDPWQWAGVRHSLSATQPAVVMVGDEVGHCKDLHVPSDSDPQSVKDARAFAEKFVYGVLSA